MSDYVNSFFRRHFPEDHANREPDWAPCGLVEQRYRGAGGSGAAIFPCMKLADGLEMSVQGHFGAYSWPRGDFEERYDQVEIMAPRDIPELADYQRDCNACGEEMIYPYVPVSVVNELIEKRGGLAGEDAPA
jgi:hypothetical protein